MARARRRRLWAPRWLRARRGEAGFTIVELTVGITLMAVVAVGFAASVGAGFRTVALARQRQTASEVATARLEHVRSVPFDDIKTDVKPANNSDPTHPDYDVTGNDYDVTGVGDLEPMIWATGAEPWGVLHVEDPVTVGSTVMEIYQYATWVDDPTIPGTENFKRVTVVVRYKSAVVNSINQTVRASSLFTEDTVTFPVATSTTTTVPASTTTTTTVPPSTTTTVAAPCPGDVDAPTGDFEVLGGSGADAGFTASQNVTLRMDFTDPCTPIVANFQNESDPLGPDVVYDPLNPEFSWTLSNGDGTKTVDGEVRDGVGNSRGLDAVDIILDTTPPTAPGNFNVSLSCSGPDRTAALSWTPSTDTYLSGYRVYRNTGSGFVELGTTAALTFNDVHQKTLNTVQFYVVGYDQAGNESNATNTISLSKNQCS